MADRTDEILAMLRSIYSDTGAACKYTLETQLDIWGVLHNGLSDALYRDLVAGMTMPRVFNSDYPERSARHAMTAADALVAERKRRNEESA